MDESLDAELQQAVEQRNAATIVKIFSKVDFQSVSFPQRLSLAEAASAIGREDITEKILNNHMDALSEYQVHRLAAQISDEELIGVLKCNVFFFNESNDTLLALARLASIQAYPPSVILNGLKGALSVIIRGKVAIRRLGDDQIEREALVDETYSFGYLDKNLGIGEVLSIKSISICAVLTVQADVFKAFLEKHPKLLAHVQSLQKSSRASTSSSAAAAGLTHRDVESAVRKGARFTLEDHPLSVRINDKNFTLKDISSTGLFVRQLTGVAMGDIVCVHFMEFGFKLDAKVVRFTPDGVGLIVQFKTDQEREKWLRFIETISQKLQLFHLKSQFFPLRTPLPVDVVKENQLYKGEIVALNEYGGMVKTKEALNLPLHAELLLQGKVRSILGAPIPFKIPSKLVGMTAQAMQFEFVQISPVVKDAFNRFVDDQDEDLTEPTGQQYIEIFISGIAELKHVYFQEISQGALVVKSAQPLNTGQRIHIRLRVTLPGTKTQIVSLAGICQRVAAPGRYVTRLDDVPSITKAKLSRVITNFEGPKSRAEHVVEGISKYEIRNSILLGISAVLFIFAIKRAGELKLNKYDLDDTLNSLSQASRYKGVIVHQNDSPSAMYVLDKKDGSLKRYFSYGSGDAFQNGMLVGVPVRDQYLIKGLKRP